MSTFILNIGNVYIADAAHHRIRKITISTDVISTIAGTGAGGYSGDNGDATSAALYNPYGIALDASGMILRIPSLIHYFYYTLLRLCILH